jgi:hypothetical protein
MIPKDSYSNLYLGIYQAEIKKAGRTVRDSGSDCPAVPSGLSAGAAQTVRVGRGRLGSTGGSGANNRPSAHLADCPRVLRASGAGVVGR